MRPPMFDWDAANEGHIARHGITPEEVEQAWTDPRRVRAQAYPTPTERRHAVVGATEGGRVLFVVYTLWRGMVRVVTAYDAEGPERRRYRRGQR